MSEEKQELDGLLLHAVVHLHDLLPGLDHVDAGVERIVLDVAEGRHDAGVAGGDGGHAREDDQRRGNNQADRGKDAALRDEIHHNACQNHKNRQHKEEHGFHPFSLLPFPYETAFLFMVLV